MDGGILYSCYKLSFLSGGHRDFINWLIDWNKDQENKDVESGVEVRHGIKN